MTDRRVSGLEVESDLAGGASRRVSGLSTELDLYDPGAQSRRLSALIIEADPIAFIQAHSVLISLLAEADCITVAAPTSTVLWSGSLFEMGTASPPVYFSAGTFQSSGAKPVVWMTDHFEVAP